MTVTVASTALCQMLSLWSQRCVEWRYRDVKWAGRHGPNEYVVLVGKETVNCGGAHVAGNQKCLVQERLVEVARVKVEQKVSYAEKVKRVEDDGSRVSSSPRPIQSDRNVCFTKVGFLAFIANCTAEIACKSEKIDVLVAAAEKYLGVWGFTAEGFLGVLNERGLSSQAVGLV